MDDRPHWLPTGYLLDILDPEVVILRRNDGSMVGAFSTKGSTPEGIRHAAERDINKQQEYPLGEVPLPRQRHSGVFRRRRRSS